jgi:hypothetical protein
MTNDRLHIVVFCWPRVLQNVLKICDQLQHFDCRKTVLDASGTAALTVPGWEWLAVDPGLYYGGQFELASQLVSADVFMPIVGDIECEDWTAVVSLCRERFAAFQSLGVWSAELDNTAWRTDRMAVCQIPNTEMYVVGQTDCCVWAIARPIMDRLRMMDLSMNNLGWGIDWAAAVTCYAQGLLAVRDKRVCLHHPAGRGYQTEAATRQMHLFLGQLTLSEQGLLAILMRSAGPPS